MRARLERLISPNGPPPAPRHTGRLAARAAPSGYTLIETLVTLALLGVIATILYPVLAAGGADQRLNQADRELKGLTDAISAFHRDVGEWPTNVEDLVNPITGGDQDICGRGYNGGERNSWNGPYLNVALPAGGLNVGIGTVRPDLMGVDAGAYDLLGIAVDNVEVSDAGALDDMVDADGDPNAGTVRWTTPAVGGVVTLTWYLPITPC